MTNPRYTARDAYSEITALDLDCMGLFEGQMSIPGYCAYEEALIVSVGVYAAKRYSDEDVQTFANDCVAAGIIFG